MPQKLVLTATEPGPALSEWRVQEFYVNSKTPAIKVAFVANTGAVVHWRAIVSETITAAQVRAACSFINQGKFMVIQGKSLEQWLIEQAQAAGVLAAGVVSGTVD